MATYVTLKQDVFGPILWHKVLRVLTEPGIGCNASVQLMSLHENVSVVDINQIDKIAKDGDLG